MGGLTAKQKKLPKALQAAILKKKKARQKMIDVLIGCVIGWVAHIAWTKWGSLLVDLNDK